MIDTDTVLTIGEYLAGGLVGTGAISLGASWWLSRKPLTMGKPPRLDVPATTAKDLAVYKEPEPVYEQYGHPWAPFPDLKAKLPKAPTNYRWEISAHINAFGNAALRLGLLDVTYGEVTDFAERDMVVIRRWKYADDDTFASFYRRTLEIHPGVQGIKAAEELSRKIFLAHLISPLVDWAKAEVARKAVTNPLALTTSYELVVDDEPGLRLVDSLKKVPA